VADGSRKFAISLTTPDGAVFEDEAEMVIVPGAAGEIGVLARHAPLIALLKAGSTRIYTNRNAEEVHEFATGPGFFTVELDRAIALVDTAVSVREIDPAIAEAQLEDARMELERLDRGESEADRWQVEQRIKAAENQLSAAGRA
jgi:F-type H+-transporting ATPase subunit epsilon